MDYRTDEMSECGTMTIKLVNMFFVIAVSLSVVMFSDSR